MEYAAQISFELLYSSECLQSQKPSEACFSVQVLYNGRALEFNDDCQRGDLCTYAEFLAYLDRRSYKGPHADNLRLACLL